MKIVSDNSKVLDELFDYLSRKNDVEKIQESKDDGGMIGLLETVGILSTSILSVLQIYEFLKKNFPDMKLEFQALGKPTIGMTVERYEELTDKAKKEIHSEFKIVIKEK